ncbi:MAG: hypothetical protein IPH81_20180 [Candidatus Microthrix sp.]|nr:hypothetical protein [Candidatus Microthrix sp.]
MPAPILLYSGPAIAPQLARVSLWGTTPHHNLVLYDENAGMVLELCQPTCSLCTKTGLSP